MYKLVKTHFENIPAKDFTSCYGRVVKNLVIYVWRYLFRKVLKPENRGIIDAFEMQSLINDLDNSNNLSTEDFIFTSFD